MMPQSKAKFVPDMMDVETENIIMETLEGLLECDKELALIWPAAAEAKKQGDTIDLVDVDVVVIPLDRIGAPVGASGACVYVAYFYHSVIKNRRSSSPPLVVKVGDEFKLKEEFDAWKSWPQLDNLVAENFAFPVKIVDTIDGVSVLIASFKSEFQTENDGGRTKVLLRDLWKLLHEKNELTVPVEKSLPHVGEVVSKTLSALQQPHKSHFANFQKGLIDYDVDYKKYLRGTTGDGKRVHIPKLFFGENQKIFAFGKCWNNPIYTMKKALELPPVEGYFGAVHGDLHPKNIVLNSNNNVRIIDFGWAKEKQHIIIDHLLLDINIRATTLPSHLSEKDIMSFSGFLYPNQDIKNLPVILQSRGGIIKNQIWGIAQEKIVTDWDKEYLVPLFLVSFGLMVYLDDVRNQSAFVATVLSLAERVEKIIE